MIIDEEKLESINRGGKHVFMLTDGGLFIKCDKCKTVVDLHNYSKKLPDGSSEKGLELWVLDGLVWSFCNKHADCEEEGEEV